MTQSSQPAVWSAHPWVAEANAGVRFAIGAGPRTADWPAHAEFVQQAEAYGFDAYWTSDHPTRAADCWTTLAAVAAVTR
jgi:alkanesulfonate monooxygenase SsuD/methylene tetrahydromethanopterin reductase-like flavin-dependent oxidoreductase (luciferase family)